GACRNMDVKIVVLKYSALFRVERFYEAQCDLDGFFHHIAQLPCDQQVPFSGGETAFDKEDLAACPCPGKAGNHAGNLLCQLPLMVHLFFPEIVGQAALCDSDGTALVFYEPYRGCPAERIDQLLEIADAGFHCI